MSTYKTDNSGDNSQVEQISVVEITASKTVSIEESGNVFLIGTDALTVTLPATKKGAKYTFINSGADGNNIITISPNASDGIFGSIANATADSVSGGVDNKNIINTKATSNKGDRITLIGDGVDGWYVAGGVGIWASQA